MQSSLFGQSNQNPQNNASMAGSLTQPSASFASSQIPSRSGAQPLWQVSDSVAVREKGIVDQMSTLLKKWSPDNGECSFQHYFYNNVGADRVPYFAPVNGEDESKWEDALAKKPGPDAVPVLCKGFRELGERLQIQVLAVQGLQSRLHEINNSLSAQQREHELDVSVRVIDSRRRHLALSQRCMRLAAKVQVLRNRGYAMDGAEEGVASKLRKLEQSALDPALSGRIDEIWARMVGLHQRAQILQSETDRMGAEAGTIKDDAQSADIWRKTKKVSRRPIVSQQPYS